MYIGQTSSSTDARYEEHIRNIRTTNHQSAYALHILDIIHEHGEQERIMEFVEACRKGKLMNCWESLYLQGYHKKGYQVTEHLKHEHNKLFDHVSTTLPTKYSVTALTAGEEHLPNQTDIT